MKNAREINHDMSRFDKWTKGRLSYHEFLGSSLTMSQSFTFSIAILSNIFLNQQSAVICLFVLYFQKLNQPVQLLS